MILYFTGTGNSRWVAEQLAALTNDTLLNLADCMKQATIPAELQQAERLGIVFPVHGWAVPTVVTDYLARLSLPCCRYRYAVCTCGDDAGKTMNRLHKLFPIDAAWSVIMPDTYIPLFKIDKPELAHRKIAAARQLLPQIARSVQREEKVWQVHEGYMPRSKSYVLRPLFVRFCISARGFHVDEGCNACGKCARLCPLDNISLVDGLPLWGDDCIHCLACIHGCPQKVIQFKKATQQKERYRLADYL